MIRRMSVWSLVGLLVAAVASAAGLEGFGAATPGGAKGEVVTVTSLEDNGPGTLREALEESNRRIVFEVAGTIMLLSQLKIEHRAFMTIDGSTAPAPGITLIRNGIDIDGSHDIVLRHLRIRETLADGIQIRRGSYNVVVDHCSITNTGDENIGISSGVNDVTVSWCLIADTRPDSFELKSKGMLLRGSAEAPVTKVTIHHNLFANLFQRNPLASAPGLFDIRNNVVRNWRAYGIRMRGGAHGNIIGNHFDTSHNRRKAVVVVLKGTRQAGLVYMHGNRGPRGLNVNALRTTSEPFAVAPVHTSKAEEAAARVLAEAGARPRDAIDTALVEAATVSHKKSQNQTPSH
jgi:pectate lyase